MKPGQIIDAAEFIEVERNADMLSVAKSVCLGNGHRISKVPEGLMLCTQCGMTLEEIRGVSPAGRIHPTAV